MDMDLWLAGLLGGCASEVLKWFRIREELHKGLPDYAKSWSYWIVTVAMAALGGVLVFMYQASDDVVLSHILAFNVGASAPLILEKVASGVPGIEYQSVD
jgi:hypothetical protein